MLVNETRGVWLLNNFTEARNAGTTLGPFEVNFNERLRKYYGAVGPFEVEFDETLHKYYSCGPLSLSFKFQENIMQSFQNTQSANINGNLIEIDKVAGCSEDPCQTMKSLSSFGKL